MSDDEFARLEKLKREKAEAFEREMRALEEEQLRRLAEKLNYGLVAPGAADAPRPAPAPVSPPAPTASPAPTHSPTPAATDAWTLERLAHLYKTDAHSPYVDLRFKTRETYDLHIRRIIKDFGPEKLSDLKTQDIWRFYNHWTNNGKVRLVSAHGTMTMLRGLINFGMTILEDSQCERLSMVLHNIRFSVPKPRTEELTNEQALLIIEKAHSVGLHSLAMAQAFQLDCKLGQKDVIGEWVPITEPGESDVTDGDLKWLRGLRWEEIDENLVLRHKLSVGSETTQISLRDAPNVLAELERLGTLPKRGPIIVNGMTDVPWTTWDFRQKWRKVARRCGISDEVKNSHTPKDSKGYSGKRRKELIEKKKKAAEGDWTYSGRVQ